MIPLLAFGLPNGMEWLVILMVVLIFFGSKRLPELARGLGRSLHEFKKAREDFEGELHKVQQEVAATAPRSPVTEAKDKQLAYNPSSALEQQVRELQEQLREIQRQNQALQASSTVQVTPVPAAVAREASTHPAVPSEAEAAHEVQPVAHTDSV